MAGLALACPEIVFRYWRKGRQTWSVVVTLDAKVGMNAIHGWMIVASGVCLWLDEGAHRRSWCERPGRNKK